MDSKIMFKLTYGLFVLTAKNDQKANGCIINTAIQHTTEPNRISITVNKQNYTTGMIQETGKFNVSFIDERADFELFKHFGFQMGREVDKFATFSDSSYGVAGNGIPYIKGVCNAYLSCEVESSVDLDSHILFIAKVVDGEKLSDEPSVTYNYYQSNIKPRQKKVESKGKVWVCRICGYIYDEDKEGVPFEELPDDWTCPVCKHGKQDFALQE